MFAPDLYETIDRPTIRACGIALLLSNTRNGDPFPTKNMRIIDKLFFLGINKCIND